MAKTRIFAFLSSNSPKGILRELSKETSRFLCFNGSQNKRKNVCPELIYGNKQPHLIHLRALLLCRRVPNVGLKRWNFPGRVFTWWNFHIRASMRIVMWLFMTQNESVSAQSYRYPRGRRKKTSRVLAHNLARIRGSTCLHKDCAEPHPELASLEPESPLVKFNWNQNHHSG